MFTKNEQLNARFSKSHCSGWLEGVEPSPAAPQAAVLPLNYSHHHSGKARETTNHKIQMSNKL